MTITSSNPSYRQHQLRKVAILVATLGEPLAEQLLADLPQQDAEEVRLLVETIDEVDPLEYETVVADFRQGTASEHAEVQPPARSEGVELDASLLARLESEEDLFEPSEPVEESSWSAINEADVSTLVEVLSAEQPQTIAVVLARLQETQAAELITHLPPAVQAEVLTRLSELDPADEQSLQVVESQLASWIQAKHQRQQRMAAGYELVQRIVDKTQSNQRMVVLEQLGHRNPKLASRLAEQKQLEPTPIERVQASATISAYQSHQATKPKAAPLPTLVEPPAESVDPLAELEALNDPSLLRALQSVDRDTVLLALAGASDALIKRIVRGLPRKQANQFRQQVRSLGPTRLSDMVAAQHELLRCSRA